MSILLSFNWLLFFFRLAARSTNRLAPLFALLKLSLNSALLLLLLLPTPRIGLFCIDWLDIESLQSPESVSTFANWKCWSELKYLFESMSSSSIRSRWLSRDFRRFKSLCLNERFFDRLRLIWLRKSFCAAAFFSLILFFKFFILRSGFSLSGSKSSSSFSTKPQNELKVSSVSSSSSRSLLSIVNKGNY